MTTHTALPDWIPAEAWAGYIEMRKKIKKPMTDRAVTLAINTLAKLRAQAIVATANCASFQDKR